MKLIIATKRIQKHISGSVCNSAIFAIFLLLFGFNLKAADVFVKGINLNGADVTIDGNSWISYSTAQSNGFSTTSVSTFSNSITWSPAVDANTNTMLNSVIYKSAGNSSMSQTIANGNYKVYFWLTENYADNARSEDIVIEGNTVAKGAGMMAKNTWAKLGPYNVTVSDGVLNIDFVRISGDPQCSGLAIFSSDSASTPVKDGWSRIEAESYNSASPGAIQKSTAMLISNAGQKWVLYDNIDLRSGTNNLEMKVANGGETAAVLLLADDVVVDTLTIENTGGWNTFQIRNFRLNTQLYGTKNVKLLFGNASVNIDWFMFSAWTSTLEKNRVIVLTDIGSDIYSDPDDRQSMVRACLYSNDIDFEGLIHQTSCWMPITDNTRLESIRAIVNAYGQVRSNLLVHANGYPTVDYLLSIIKLGQTTYGMAGVGTGKDSDGSNLIIAAVDKNDPRPVWISCWGGMSTLAQALWKVQHTRTPEQMSQFVNKIRVYDIAGQDDAGAWIKHNFPNLFYICSIGQFYGMGTQGNTSLCDSAWLANNVQNHGLLGAQYPKTAWTMEGDSPSFIYLITNGLHDPMVLDQGGWGGRFNAYKTLNPRSTQNSGKVSTDQSKYDSYYMYTETSESGNSQKPVFRWRAGYQNDMAARMDWSINSSYSAANHNPVAVVNSDTTKEILQISAVAGSSLVLSAAGSKDPDGNALVYSWWRYNESGTYPGTVNIQNSTTASATVAVPSDASGKTIDVVLELHDNGTPNLYAYRRIIINVL
jgi:Protein of unknown function (DUF1593).